MHVARGGARGGHVRASTRWWHVRAARGAFCSSTSTYIGLERWAGSAERLFVESAAPSGVPASSASVKPGVDAVHPKEAETQERSPDDPLLVVQRALDENMAAAGIASALAPDESGFRQRVKDGSDAVTSESID